MNDPSGQDDEPSFESDEDLARWALDFALVSSSPLQPGMRLDHFEILKSLGSGGFSEVFQAIQLEPMRREVALKVLKWARVDENIIQRFDYERSILVKLSHPHLVRILDCGVSMTGLPWLSMDLVQGLPIQKDAQLHQLPLTERIRMFLQVTEAVTHAHRNGIIHRDLKPSNILIDRTGEQPMVKVIDFGVAKMVNETMPSPLLTRAGEVLGTPAYMSPEQAEARHDLVDTRSDIYSLGVVLYELLTDCLPFGTPSPTKEDLTLFYHRIATEEPPRASQLVLEKGKPQQLENRKMARQLRGNLDWILRKCLQKDPKDRYATVEALKQDLEHHLKGLPIEAAGPSFFVLALAFLRRNRLATATVVACFIGLAIGMLGMIRQWAETEQVKVQVHRHEHDAKLALQGLRRDQRALISIEGLIQKNLGLLHPGKEEVKATARDFRNWLERSALDLGRPLSTNPTLESQFRLILAEAFFQIGAYQQASEQVALFEALQGERNGDELPEDIIAILHFNRQLSTLNLVAPVAPEIIRNQTCTETLNKFRSSPEVERLLVQLAESRLALHGHEDRAALSYLLRAGLSCFAREDMDQAGRIFNKALLALQEAESGDLKVQRGLIQHFRGLMAYYLGEQELAMQLLEESELFLSDLPFSRSDADRLLILISLHSQQHHVDRTFELEEKLSQFWSSQDDSDPTGAARPVPEVLKNADHTEWAKSIPSLPELQRKERKFRKVISRHWTQGNWNDANTIHLMGDLAINLTLQAKQSLQAKKPHEARLLLDEAYMLAVDAGLFGSETFQRIALTQSHLYQQANMGAEASFWKQIALQARKP